MLVSDSIAIVVVVVASVVVSAETVVVATVVGAAVVVMTVVVVVVDVVVSCLNLSRTSMTDSVVLEIFWLRPDNVSFGGSSWR